MIDSMTSARERIGRLDVVIAVVASLIAVGDMLFEHFDDEIKASYVAAPLFLGVTVPLLWRRVAPLGALVATLVALLVHVALFGDGAVRCGIVLPVAFLLAYSVAARAEGRQALLGLFLALALGVTVCLSDAPSGATIAAMSFVGPLILVVWGIGRVARSRGRIVGELEVRASELRDARDQRARLEVATDRARLSSELDELLQRRLATLAQLAEGEGHNGDARVALAEIEHESRRALDEMRALVGVLRHDQGGAPMAPQPTLTQLEALLIRVKGTGAALTVEGSPRALPAGVELSAYRVVEQLLDALQDAPGVEVCVRFADDALELTVAGPVRRRGEEAIERARERVRLHRGTLQATTRDGRAEAVVSLPLLAAV